MKQALLLLLLAFGMNSITAQPINYSSKTNKTLLTKAPKAVSTKFAAEYPGIKPVWKMADNNYEATYTDPDTKLNNFVLYDKEGGVIKKETELNYTDYPVKINQYYSQRFPEEKIHILKCEAPNGENYYFAKHKDRIIKFDTDGNYMAEKNTKIKASEINNKVEAK
ncbi:MAG: hypothetical protein ABIP51_17810 [Bacteroidia bacterium]